MRRYTRTYEVGYNYYNVGGGLIFNVKLSKSDFNADLFCIVDEQVREQFFKEIDKSIKEGYYFNPRDIVGYGSDLNIYDEDSANLCNINELPTQYEEYCETIDERISIDIEWEVLMKLDSKNVLKYEWMPKLKTSKDLYDTEKYYQILSLLWEETIMYDLSPTIYVNGDWYTMSAFAELEVA